MISNRFRAGLLGYRLVKPRNQPYELHDDAGLLYNDLPDAHAVRDRLDELARQYVVGVRAEDGLPIVRPLSLRMDRTGTKFRVVCPFCRDVHDYTGQPEGEQSSHCRDGWRRYVVLDTDGLYRRAQAKAAS